MQQENFSPQESLKVIEKMIGKVKASYYETGISPILWGSTVSVCGIVSYFAITYNHLQWFNIWFLTLAAIIPQIIISIQEKKQRKFTSLIDDATDAIWTVFGFSLMMLSIINAIKSINIPISVYILIYGMPTITTGLITKFKPMLIGGIICWLCAVASVFVKFPNQYLFVAVAAIAAWLIPGIILNTKYRKQKAVNV